MVKGKTDNSQAQLENLENGKIQEEQEDRSGFVETPSVMLKGQPKESSQPCLGKIVGGKNEEVASESVLDFEVTKHEAEKNPWPSELDDYSR